MTHLPRRLATAAVVLPLLLLLVVRGPAPLVEAVVGLCVLIGLAESYALLSAGGVAPFRITGVLLTVSIFLHVARGAALSGALWPVAVLGVAIAALERARRDLRGSLAAAAATWLVAAYLGALGGSLAALRNLEPLAEGPMRLLLLLAIVMVADTFAFAAGSALGRRRLAPRLSPNKTVEGAAGAILGGVVGAAGMRLAGLELPWAAVVALGAAIAGTAILGDLAESLLKRWAGVKDSGRLFPGHGGMLDRLDSLLFGAPVLYYYYLYAAH